MKWQIRITEIELDFENDFGDNDPDFQDQVYNNVLYNQYEIEIIPEKRPVIETVYNELSYQIGWGIKWVDFVLIQK